MRASHTAHVLIYFADLITIPSWNANTLLPHARHGVLTRLVTRLNEVRDDHTTYNNRLDTTLADIFNLLSLFFLTIGKTRECPATYSQIASMRVSHLLVIFSAFRNARRHYAFATLNRRGLILQRILPCPM